MEKVIEQLEILRHFTGNTQLGYLSTFKSDLLKEILEYTYNPHKKYKIDEGKYDKITTTIGNKLSLTIEEVIDYMASLYKICPIAVLNIYLKRISYKLNKTIIIFK